MRDAWYKAHRSEIGGPCRLMTAAAASRYGSLRFALRLRAAARVPRASDVSGSEPQRKAVARSRSASAAGPAEARGRSYLRLIRRAIPCG